MNNEWHVYPLRHVLLLFGFDSRLLTILSTTFQ